MAKTLPEGRLTVQDFMKYAGWESSYNPEYIRIAMEFFQCTVPSHVWRESARNPGPWLLPRENAVRLCEWMQSIDFDYPVSIELLRPGQILKKYNLRGQPSLGFGNFFTLCNQSAEKLGIYQAQTMPLYFEVKRFAQCLRSSVSDAYADWRQGSAPEYRHGGGVQIFIWNSELVLKKAAVK